MSNSNHDESLAGLQETGDIIGGKAATPVTVPTAGAAAGVCIWAIVVAKRSLEMVETFEDWLMLATKVSVSAALARVLTTLSRTVELVEVCSGMFPCASKEVKGRLQTELGFDKVNDTLQEWILHATRDLHENTLNQLLCCYWKCAGAYVVIFSGVQSASPSSLNWFSYNALAQAQLR